MERWQQQTECRLPSKLQLLTAHNGTTENVSWLLTKHVSLPTCFCRPQDPMQTAHHWSQTVNAHIQLRRWSLLWLLVALTGHHPWGGVACRTYPGYCMSTNCETHGAPLAEGSRCNCFLPVPFSDLWLAPLHRVVHGCRTMPYLTGRDCAVSPSITSMNASRQVVHTAAALCICKTQTYSHNSS
jgi:hypothetical protein